MPRAPGLRLSCRPLLLAACLLAAGCVERAGPAAPAGASTPGSGPAHGASGDDVSAAVSNIRFTEMTPGCGIEFTYSNDEQAGHFAILESLGGGVALFDFDSDGRLDVFLPGGGRYGPKREVLGRRPALFRNTGLWKYAEATGPAGLAEARHFSHGGAAGDFDNDGFIDLLVTGYGGVRLYRNQGDGTFAEIAHASGLTDALWSSSAAWGDVDGDGDLDLYIAHYVDWAFDPPEKNPFCEGPRPDLREVCPPRRFEPLPDVLYENRGDGTFADVSSAAGLRTDGKGLGVLLGDVDLDGDLDIYVANDTVPNFLYRNTGRGRFDDVSTFSGTSVNDMGTPDGSMGVDLGDFNGDGLPDLWVANFEREAFALYRNEGNCLFQHVSQPTGVTALGGLYVGWGTVFLDVDRDGDEDVFASNGHVIRYPMNAPLHQTPLLLLNEAGKRFVNVSPQIGGYFAAPHMGRGAALGDLDDDGDLDLAVSHTNEPASLLSNESADANGWISLRLIGVASSREPIGAIVRVEAGPGTRVYQVKGGASYASTCDRRVFAGLGAAGQADRVEIRWPSGRTQTLTGVPARRQLTVVEQAQ